MQAWRLSIGDAHFRFIRPDAGVELLEERGIKPPRADQIAQTVGEKVLRGPNWKIVEAPITDTDFMDLPMV